MENTMTEAKASVRTEDVLDLLDYEKARENLCFFLTGSITEKNSVSDTQAETVTFDWLDLQASIHLKVFDGVYTTATKRLLDKWNVCKEDLIYDTEKAMRKNAVLKRLRDFLPGAEPDPETDSILVLTNKDKFKGAGTILADGVLSMIASAFDDKPFYLLPSSIHEWIIIPADSGEKVSDLERLVRQVNEEQVAPEDRLSNSVYVFDPFNSPYVRIAARDKRAVN